MLKEEFVKRAIELYWDKYDYSNVPQTFTTKDKVQIICHEVDKFGREHGLFEKKVEKFLKGQGCTKCSGRYKRTKEDFVFEANKVHDGLYSYNTFDYKDMHTKGEIYCTKHKLYFQMTPQHHISGQGCPKCRYEKTSKSKSLGTERFVEKAKTIHGDKYDYSKVEYVNYGTNVKLICPKHGEFNILPLNHLFKHKPQGCPKCGIEKCAVARSFDNNEFIRRARNVHGDRYNYSNVEYYRSDGKLKIICPIHGEFKQIARNHLQGQGCPKCNSSHLETEIRLFLQENNIEFEEQKKFPNILGSRSSVDFFLPKYNSIIECQGKQHFGIGGWNDKEKQNNLIENDKRKMEELPKNGFKLFFYSNLGIDYPYKVFEDKSELLAAIVKSQ